MISDSQMRQALDVVLRELAESIVRVLEQQRPKAPGASGGNAGMSTEPTLSPPDGRLLVTMAEAAAMLSISRSRLYQLVYEGRLPTIQIGRSRRVSVSALQHFVTRELENAI